MARKPACLFYRRIQYSQQYVDKGAEHYAAKYRDQQNSSLDEVRSEAWSQVLTAPAA